MSSTIRRFPQESKKCDLALARKARSIPSGLRIWHRWAPDKGKGYTDFADFAHPNGFKTRFQEDGFIENLLLVIGMPQEKGKGYTDFSDKDPGRRL